MNKQINLLNKLPKTKRNIQMRAEAKDPKMIAAAREYGELYFDGPREFGYGGYKYDGRWIPVAQDIIKQFNLKAGDRVLDIGCAKGFLMKDLMQVCPGLEVFGVDVSEYAIMRCEKEVIGRIHQGSADKLLFPNNSFACVLSLNTIHNLKRDRALVAMQEIERVSGGRAFVQVDSYLNKEQKAIFESWVLTAEFHDYPAEWEKLFKEAKYSGYYDWTIID